MGNNQLVEKCVCGGEIVPFFKGVIYDHYRCDECGKPKMVLGQREKAKKQAKNAETGKWSD